MRPSPIPDLRRLLMWMAAKYAGLRVMGTVCRVCPTRPHPASKARLQGRDCLSGGIISSSAETRFANLLLDKCVVAYLNSSKASSHSAGVVGISPSSMAHVVNRRREEQYLFQVIGLTRPWETGSASFT